MRPIRRSEVTPGDFQWFGLNRVAALLCVRSGGTTDMSIVIMNSSGRRLPSAEHGAGFYKFTGNVDE